MEKIRDFLTGVLITLIFILLVGLAGGVTRETPEELKAAETYMQQYIVRYAIATEINDDGVTTYEDENGNLWAVQDAPTEIGCEARLLFNTNETATLIDDKIIDITD